MYVPKPNEYANFYRGYVEIVPDEDPIEALVAGKQRVWEALAELSTDKWSYRYEKGKWSLKELWLHVIDTERIMAYRALCISRGEKTPLPGFEQDDYVPHSAADERKPVSILEEYLAVREASLALFRHLPEKAWKRMGTASGQPISVRALAYIIAGHEMHHLQVVREKYL